MTMQDFIAYQEQTFDSYCKRIIQNESRDAMKELSRRAKREVSISEASGEELGRLQYLDTYHLERTAVSTRRDQVTTDDITLGQALMQLPPKLREPILLLYFHGLTERQIGDLLNVTPRTISNRKNKALAMLKRIIEGLECDGK